MTVRALDVVWACADQGVCFLQLVTHDESLAERVSGLSSAWWFRCRLYHLLRSRSTDPENRGLWHRISCSACITFHGLDLPTQKTGDCDTESCSCSACIISLPSLCIDCLTPTRAAQEGHGEERDERRSAEPRLGTLCGISRRHLTWIQRGLSFPTLPRPWRRDRRLTAVGVWVRAQRSLLQQGLHSREETSELRQLLSLVVTSPLFPLSPSRQNRDGRI